MRLAIPCTMEGTVNMPFGHTEFFKIYEIEENKVVSSKMIGNGGYEHRALVTYLKLNDVDLAIIGNIGQHGLDAFDENGIKVYTSVSGRVDEVVENYLNGTLELKKEARGCHAHG